MLRTTVLPVVFFALVGFACDVSALPTTTTTTTTTTTVPPSTAYHGRPVSSNPCQQWWVCVDELQTYNTIVSEFDFAGLASVAHQLCHVAMPAVEQCLRDREPVDRKCESPTPQLRFFQEICLQEAALTSGAACWSNGFQSVMADCVDAYSKEGLTVGACQANFNLKQCVAVGLLQIPQCSRDNVGFIVDILHTSTRQFCNTGDLPFDF